MSQFLYKAFQSNDMINPRHWRCFFYVQNTASAGHKPQSYSLQGSGRKWDIVINLFEYLIAKEVVRDRRAADQRTGIMGTAADGFFKPGLKWCQENQTWHQKSHNSYVFNYRIASRGPALNIL